MLTYTYNCFQSTFNLILSIKSEIHVLPLLLLHFRSLPIILICRITKGNQRFLFVTTQLLSKVQLPELVILQRIVFIKCNSIPCCAASALKTCAKEMRNKSVRLSRQL